jgi:butyryl-CoA dehydrogenase
LDHHLTEDQRTIRDLARTIAEEKVKPVRAKYDEENIFPWDVVEALAKVDLFRVFIPTAYDGLVEQKRRYLPDIAAGKRLAAFGLTEPMAGSDASAQRTTARRDGDTYVLNGTKVFITNGGEADVYTTVALTNPEKGARGASCFIVEKGMPGFSFGKKETKMGIHASVTRELIFDGARVPKENLLGKEGMGFLVAMKTFDISRPGVGAQALGIAEGALEETLKYAHTRHQFGQSIMNFQGLQWMLADMATQIEAVRALIYSLAARIDSGDTRDIGHLSAMAKASPSEWTRTPLRYIPRMCQPAST